MLSPNPPRHPDHHRQRPGGSVRRKPLVITKAQLAAFDVAMHQAEIAFALQRRNPDPRLFCEESLVILQCDPAILPAGFSVTESARELARYAKLARSIAHAL
jgi:hypothetical protein